MSMTKRILAGLFALVFAVTGVLPVASAGPGDPETWQAWKPGSERWEYNPGPDPRTEEGRRLIDLYAGFPDYSEFSNALMDAQKFRYIFGMMLTRTYYEKNSVKILFIGQDATHIAEAAKQPGTSGFGGRVQSVGNHFGVDQGVATTNAYVSTIKGQYGAFDHIYVEMGEDGIPLVKQSSYVDNELWMLSNGRQSEILLKREEFWEWMIRNNPDSLKLMVMFGGAARDSWAEFLIGRGWVVPTRMDPERLKAIQVPETKLVYAGGNNEFPVPIDRKGRDIYEVLVGRRLDYTDVKEQQLAVETLKKSGQRGIDMMVYTGGGLHGSGVVNAAQLGGYDLDRATFNGKRTNSLKGMVLKNGYVVRDHIGFTMSPHPTVLSSLAPEEASKTLRKALARLEELKKLGWYIEPDLGADGKPMVNHWHEGHDYGYGKADVRGGYAEFGAPLDRRVVHASASRLDPQTIVAGSRSRVKFDQRKLSAAKSGKPSKALDPRDTWSGRPRQKETRYVFDRGPGQATAELLMTNLDAEALFEPKPGMKVMKGNRDITFETHGIDAYNVKTTPGTGFFGLHRGSFTDSEALVLFDPHGLDDWNTSRAATGARGQYLNGLMEDLGFSDKYLVLKTVPVGMDGATAEEWEVVRRQTEKYREVAIQHALENPKIKTIFTDGEIAKAEMERVLNKLGVRGKTVINIQRDGMKAESGIAEAGKEALAKLKGLKKGTKISAAMSDIPRSHLTWWSRLWEGTGGDSVVDALGKERGGVRALVTPDWVAKQKIQATEVVKQSIAEIKSVLEKQGIRLGKEDIAKFLERRGLTGGGSFQEVEEFRKKNGIRPTRKRNGLMPDPRCIDTLGIPPELSGFGVG